ncbi:MAG: Tfp pilus assembly protein FimT/FimU [Aquincola tertiaricarbonis]
MPTALRRLRQDGLTLIELLVVAAIVAVFMAVGLPSYPDFSARQRLAGATEQLALELQQARFDAVLAGRAMYVNVQGGPQWCYAVSHEPGCDCRAAASPAPACALRRIDGSAHVQVQLTGSHEAVFDGRLGRAEPGLVAELALGSRSAEVRLAPSGRARACGQGAELPGLPRC